MRLSGLVCGIDPEASSGGAVHERELQRALLPLAESDILLARGKPYPAELVLRIVPTWPTRGQRWPVMATAGAAQLLRHARQWQPDALRAHSILGPGLAALLVRRATGIPVVVHVHHLDSGRHGLRDAILRSADRITVLSHFTKDQVSQIGIERARIARIGAGVYMPQPAPEQRAAWPVVLFLGELKRRKRVDFLLRAWCHVQQAMPSAQLWIVGDGPERHRLERLVERLAITETVWMFGRVREVDKSRYYHAAWTFAFPSELEGFGMPVLEAMSHGCTVVTSGAAALDEIHGPIVSSLAAGPAAFAAALMYGLDRKRREEADALNRVHASAYSWRRVAERTLLACNPTKMSPWK